MQILSQRISLLCSISTDKYSINYYVVILNNFMYKETLARIFHYGRMSFCFCVSKYCADNMSELIK